MKIEPTILISMLSLGIAFVVCIVNVLTFTRSTKQSDEKRIEEQDLKFSSIQKDLIKANLKLDNMNTAVNEIKTDTRNLMGEITEIRSVLSTHSEKIRGVEMRVSALESWRVRDDKLESTH